MQFRRTGSWFLSVFLVSLVGTPLTAQESPKETRKLTIGVRVEQGVDDNVTGDDVGSAFWEVTPEIEFHQYLRRGSIVLSYQPTVRRFSAVSTRDRLNHFLMVNFDYRLSKRWSVTSDASLLRSDNPFLRIGSGDDRELTPQRVLIAPNNGFVGPQQTFTRTQSNLAFRYLLGRNSRVNFGAQYFQEKQDEENQFFPDQRTHAFWGQYGKQYARDKSFSGLYSYQVFQSSQDELRVRTHSVIATHTYELRPGTSLALFAGPQYSFLDARPTITVFFFIFPVTLRPEVEEKITSLSVGAVFRHRFSERTDFTANLSRRISEGGRLTGTVLQRALRVNFRRKLTRYLSLQFRGYATDNRPLTAVASVSTSTSTRTWGFSSGINYSLSRNLGVGINYEFARITQGPENIAELFSRNQLSIGLRYSFGTIALGR